MTKATAPSGLWIAKKMLKPLASLKLTVVLLAMAILLVFCGSLAQRFEDNWTVVGTYFRTAFVWIPFQIFFVKEIPGAFPFFGGWLIGGVLLVNVLAAHAVRFKMAWPRAGIFLIHLGLIVMLLSELFTGLFAREGNMTIDIGGTSNYVEHMHSVELAIVDPSDRKMDDITVIPQSILKKGGKIRHDLLPFDIMVKKYMVNSGIPKDPAWVQNPATAGQGLKTVVLERPGVTGTDSEQMVDMPSAYAELLKKGTSESLGTYLVSLWLDPQKVMFDGKTFEISLRFKRTYKPYSLRLKEFRHDKYIGTDTPKNFSSLVRLEDPLRNVDREVLIYMNHPLRYAGETFYQASFKPDDSATILQVVRNQGWFMPYISCAMVVIGLLAQFGIHLFKFLRRRAEA
ncbi:MAG: cytochrome c biogenesis protein ResB [Acidobacteria bacterium]|nr:cytochrome c biogenesis protein ResB [Acidobacteriota bacterium]MBI3657047.1 cytochrome c biogenesis protein ResB [Acidobacteriota bacterium]